MEEFNNRKRARVGSDPVESDPVESDFQLDSTKAKKFKDDLLSILEDPEPVPESDPDLDSVIRSFEEEITRSSGSGSGSGSQASVIDLTSDSGENLPELGQLFSGESEIRVVEGGEFSEIGELWNFQDELGASYDDPFGLGINYDLEEIIGANNNNEIGTTSNNNNNSNSDEYVALDGIFDYGSEVNFGSDFLWRQDSLPAI